ncbi:MAG TPA: GNAT family N-acetyltransferase [Anaerolineales bacterium]|nr:GNAT family N-acetyltransferase [Anaerolineales bacterium]
MPQIIEIHRDHFTISTDPKRLDNDAIAEMLKRSYWASERTRERLDRALANSLVFGLYDGEKQIGLARVVSDYAVFAYLCDVFIHEDYRAHGLGKWLMQTVHSHPDLQGLRRWLLATRDAHGLYAQYGWKALGNPERWMENFNG